MKWFHLSRLGLREIEEDLDHIPQSQYNRIKWKYSSINISSCGLFLFLLPPISFICRLHTVLLWLVAGISAWPVLSFSFPFLLESITSSTQGGLSVHLSITLRLFFFLSCCCCVFIWFHITTRCPAALLSHHLLSLELSFSLSLWSVQHCCNSAQSEVDNSAGCPNSLSFSSLLLWTFVVCSFSDCSRDHQVFFFSFLLSRSGCLSFLNTSAHIFAPRGDNVTHRTARAQRTERKWTQLNNNLKENLAPPILLFSFIYCQHWIREWPHYNANVKELSKLKRAIFNRCGGGIQTGKQTKQLANKKNHQVIVFN